MVKLSEKDAAALLGHKGYRRRHKFNATRVEVDGIWFDSKREAKRYGELKMLEKLGLIRNLELQPAYSLEVMGWEWNPNTRIGEYRADFRYEARNLDASEINLQPWQRLNWRTVVEDVKGFKTALYRWKKRHVEAQYGITVVEI